MCPEEVVKSSPRLLPLLRRNYWEQEEPIQDENLSALIRRERITLPDLSSEIFSDSTSTFSHHSYKHFPEEENFTEHQSKLRQSTLPRIRIKSRSREDQRKDQ